jgi:subtilisin-like proprotein convertase family protein
MYKLFLFFGGIIFWVSGNAQNKVGIGTTSPTEQLHTTDGVRFEKLSGNGTRPVYVDAQGRIITSNEFNNNGVSQAITDNNCASPVISAITVTGFSAPVSSDKIVVKLNISHTYDGDLVLMLISPLGDSIFLSYTNGGSGDNYTNTVFKTGGANISAASPPFTGVYYPQGLSGTAICSGAYSSNRNSFTQFGGGSIIPNGIWKLLCFDFAIGDQGYLQNWTISFDGNTPDNKASEKNFFKCVPFNNVTIPVSSSSTKLIFSSTTSNDEGAYNTNTGNYTAPYSGLYEFTLNMQWYIQNLSAGTTENFSQEIFVNGIRSYYFNNAYANSPSVGYTCSAVAQIHLNAGDVVEFYVRHTSTFSQSLLRSNFILTGDPGYMTHISGRRIYAD